jgi:hypothetical protein
MSPELTLVLALVAVAAVGLWVLRERRRYPLIACGRCHGNSMHTKWIFHVRSLRLRKVGGHCGSCGGKAWTER